jgi:hypothetical protein
VKRDDAGAAEQQRSARENAGPIELAELSGPPVVAPIVEEKLSPKINITSDGSRLKSGEEIAMGSGIHLYATDLPFPGEVILDVRRKDGSEHQRFSTYTSDGSADFALAAITPSPGEWVYHVESPVTRVGEGRDDHLPLIHASDEQSLVVK